MNNEHHIVIIGGGFGGLYAARALGNANARVTLIDKRNFHLFQPLLYQVATGSLSAGDIASPLRHILRDYPNVHVLLDEVIDVDVNAKTVRLKGKQEPLAYDTLIMSAGGTHQYFGHDEWQEHAPSLKTMEDALKVRRQILLAFEEAEKESDLEKQQACTTFVIIGGGPTGVEMAGAMAELAYKALYKEFKTLNTKQARVILLEAGDRILPTYPPELSQNGMERLIKLGVTVKTNSMVQNIEKGHLTIKSGDQIEELYAHTILWTAGIKVSPFAKVLSEKTGCELDRGGRVILEPDLSIPKHPELFVVGDMGHFAHTPNGQPLPGLASVAMQEGTYVGQMLKRRLAGEQNTPAFHYNDKGSMAIIGRNSAVAEISGMKFSGLFAWLLWLLIHIFYLIGFHNKVLVLFQWVWTYLTRTRTACLITYDEKI